MLNESLMSRVQPLNDCKVDYSGSVIYISWKRKESVHTGDINMGFYQSIDSEGNITHGPPFCVVSTFVSSSFSIDGSRYRINPIEGMSAIFSMLATLDDISRQSQISLSHEVDANHYSAPIFRRLSEDGIYRPGIRKYISGKVIDEFETSLPYPADYSRLLTKFIIREASLRAVALLTSSKS